jgi:general secretion pathway protein M
MSTAASAMTPLRLQLQARWKALSDRERTALALAIAVVLGFALWSLAIGPAWRTVRQAPQQLDRLDTQLQRMQSLAAESRELRATAAITPAQASAALKAATDRLGSKARLSLVGERGTATLSGVSGEALRQWLAEVRSGARARVVEAQLSRGPAGVNGSVVLLLPNGLGGN